MRRLWRPVPMRKRCCASGSAISLAEDPAIGMWKERKDMQDSVAWVRRERERWNECLRRQEYLLRHCVAPLMPSTLLPLSKDILVSSPRWNASQGAEISLNCVVQYSTDENVWVAVIDWRAIWDMGPHAISPEDQTHQQCHIA